MYECSDIIFLNFDFFSPLFCKERREGRKEGGGKEAMESRKELKEGRRTEREGGRNMKKWLEGRI